MTEDDHRQIAARCNNGAWDLIEREGLTSEEQAELVALAATARHHWCAVGGASEIAHAELLFAWALARAGAGQAAMVAGQRALDGLAEAADWEKAFAHGAMAAASLAAGAPHGSHYRQAEALGKGLSGADARYFQAAFRTVPAPE